jgi:hypothetical protein
MACPLFYLLRSSCLKKFRPSGLQRSQRIGRDTTTDLDQFTFPFCYHALVIFGEEVPSPTVCIFIIIMGFALPQGNHIS